MRLPAYLLYTLLWLSVILWSSCANRMPQTGAATAPPQKLLLFQKTPCYGSCPAYNATFYSNGKVFYEGFRNVPVRDTLTLELTAQQLQRVQQTIQNLKYNSLENSYLSPYTDLPSSYLTFYENGKEVKRIKHQQDGPEQLRQTIGLLHELVMQLLPAK